MERTSQGSDAPVMTAHEVRETCEARRPARLLASAEVHAFSLYDPAAPAPERVLGLTVIEAAPSVFAAPQARMAVTRDMLDVLVFLARDDAGYDALIQDLMAA